MIRSAIFKQEITFSRCDKPVPGSQFVGTGRRNMRVGKQKQKQTKKPGGPGRVETFPLPSLRPSFSTLDAIFLFTNWEPGKGWGVVNPLAMLVSTTRKKAYKSRVGGYLLAHCLTEEWKHKCLKSNTGFWPIRTSEVNYLLYKEFYFLNLIKCI